jgi:hypothetical protein
MGNIKDIKDILAKTVVGTGTGAVILATGGAIGIATIGFSTVGPVAGSLAASWMSTMATTNGVGVASSGLYATIQSMAMKGAVVKTLGIIGGVIGGTVGASVSIIPRIFNRKRK